MQSDCKLEHQTAQPTLSLRFQAPLAGLASEFRRAYAALGAYLEEVGAHRSGPAFAIYHGRDSSALDVEAGFVVARPAQGRGEIRAGALAEGELVTTIHTGPYETIGATYSALMDWTHGNGLTGAGPCAEFYLDDPVTTPPAQLRTKLVLPVEAA